MSEDSIFFECRSKNCERVAGKACIIVMPNTSRYDVLFDKANKYRKVGEPIPIACPFLEIMDCDNSEWEQINKVTITRKY